MSWARALLITLVVFMLTACGTVTAPATVVRATPATTDTLHAAMAIVDITPAPGLGLHGHGPSGRVSQGTLLRLRCQPLVLAQGDEAMALVPCDLAWPSLMLQRLVAKETQRLMGEGAKLDASRIVIFATHTHGSMGHVFAAPNYSGPISAPIPGYSEAVAAFVAGQIAAGIVAAWGELRPAKLGWGFETVYGLTRNRSMDAFANNLLTETEKSHFAGRDDLPIAERIIDPTVSVLRVDELDGARPIGAIAFFGSHPTAISNANLLYHGDLFGYATRAYGEQCRASGEPCMKLGIANGVSGDVSPRAEEKGTREARRLGEALAAAIRRALERVQMDDLPPGSLRAAYQEIDMRSAPIRPDGAFFAGVDAISPWSPSRDASDPVAVCSEARLGISAGGGSEDGLTGLHFLGDQFVEGSPLATDPDGTDCHRPKRNLELPWGSSEDFPVVAPFFAARLGRVLLTTFPAEVTVTAGLRARHRIEKWLMSTGPALDVVQATLTTEYFQYVTTADEYVRQNYEGASNLYGPASIRLMANQQLCLARRITTGVACRQPVGTAALDTVREVRFAAATTAVDPLRRVYVADHDAPPQLSRVARVVRDGEVGLGVELRLPGVDDIHVVPRVRVLDTTTHKVIDDDEGTGVSRRFVARDVPGGCSDAAEARGGCPFWEIAWYPSDAIRKRTSHRDICFSIRLATSIGAGLELDTCAAPRQLPPGPLEAAGAH